MRVAIYARYSSEHQSERSIDDQVRLCRENAEARGWTVKNVYADYAISGAHLGSRPQARALMENASHEQYDIVMAEALDRLSRDQEDIASIYKRLSFSNVTLFTVSEGEVNELHVGLKGTMNAMFIKELRLKVKRGQEGVVALGKSAGGLAYGYDVVREFDDKGELIRGLRKINEEQANIVRRIYREFASGVSARKIAHGLNKDGIKSPSGSEWRTAAITGNRARGSGILWNSVYKGILVYNRVSMYKHPDTGKRISRPNPPEEWRTTEVPDLRIVEDDLWEAVQAVNDRHSTKPQKKTKRPKHLLSGLIRCGVCGGSYTIYSPDRLRCTRSRDAGTCSNCRTAKMSDIEDRVLGGLKSRLLHPKALAAFITTYEAERKQLRKENAASMQRWTKRLTDVDKEIDNLITVITQGLCTDSTKKKLLELEEEKKDLTLKIGSTQDDNVVSMHPSAVSEYRGNVNNLFETLRGDEIAKAEASTLLRAVIDHIKIEPLEEYGKYDVKVVTRVETLIGLTQGAQADLLVPLVAEERYRRNQQVTLAEIAC